MSLKPALVAVAAAAAAAATLATAAAASADAEVQYLGQPGELVNGDIVQHWTVTDLKPSSDVIPYQPAGTLWEATATDEAIAGYVTPVVSNLNARAANGDTYRVLFGVATEQGVNPSTLAQGEKTTGKIYFDVTGEEPDSVFYSDGGPDALLWLEAPPAPATGSGASSGSSYGGQASPAVSGTAETAPPDTVATPAEGTATPAPEAMPAGSSGTPLPEGSSGTPLPEGSTGTPLPTDAATAETGPAPTAAAVAPAPHGSSGTPLPAGSSGTPLPEGASSAPLEGVQSVPAPGAPTTTVMVPAPPA